MFLAKNEFLEKVSSSVQKEYNDLMASNDVLIQSLETKFNLLKHDNSLEQTIDIIKKKMRDKVKRFDAETKVFANKISKLEKVLEQRVKEFDELASQNYTSLQKENNDLRISYNELKETYETDCEKLKKEKDELKMHYKRLFDSIKQKKVDSQVFTNSKVNFQKRFSRVNLQNRFRKRCPSTKSCLVRSLMVPKFRRESLQCHNHDFVKVALYIKQMGEEAAVSEMKIVYKFDSRAPVKRSYPSGFQT
uniref:Outer membrane protein porin n=1 Tax=Tanacetum cinerariifolium TaxID=118510 RepID=A0A699GNS2_TANCI|nr:hypothetical protein [Tanacetum cinerariifolium]